MTRIKAFIPLMIPLFISAFQRAEELAIAMEVRGYDANVNRTSYRKLQWHIGDTMLNKYHPNSHSIISIKIY